MSTVTPTRQYLSVDAEGIPGDLKALSQWVNWVEEVRDGGVAKVPITPGTRRRADTTDLSTTRSFEEALSAYRTELHDGIGFVLSGLDPFTALDLDHCVDTETGAIVPWAARIVELLDSYTEASPSGTGIRIIVRGRLKTDAEGNPTGRNRVKRGDFEVYDGLTKDLKHGGRFVTITGRAIGRRDIEERQAELDQLYEELFGPAERLGDGRVTSSHFEAGAWPVDDEQLIERLLRDEKGRKLFSAGDTSAYARDNNEGRSEADQALCNKLAFYTRDPNQIDRIFRQSRLCRSKWLDRPDYRDRTIHKALSTVTEAYEWKGNARKVSLAGASPPSAVPDSEPWPAMTQLPEQLPVAPTLPPELLPESLRPWLTDIAERLNVPLEMPAAAALVALGATIGRGLGIYPKEHDDGWLVTPNLFGGLCGPPGILKTSAISEATKPLRRIEAEAFEQFGRDQAENEAYKERLRLEMEDQRRRMKEALKKNNHDGLEKIQAEFTAKAAEIANAELTARRFTTQDATVEKLGELLRENPRGLLVYRDELAGWLQTLEKAGREGDREFYLEAWNGTGSFTFDRIARGTVHIPAVCLSILGGIQPGKLRKYIIEALAGGTGADGLLQRLQVVVWPEHLGEWENVDRHPDRSAAEKALEIFRRLSELDSRALDPQAEHQSDDRELGGLHFDPEAQLLFNEWRGGLEARLREPAMRRTPAFESHLSKYRSLMPSLALIFHLVEWVDGGTDSLSVSLKAAALAISWCDYLEQHARRIYASETNHGVIAAHALLELIEDGKIKHGTRVRGIYRGAGEGLTDAATVHAAIKVLEQHHIVRMGEVSTGGRPSYVVHLHPTLRDRAKCH